MVSTRSFQNLGECVDNLHAWITTWKSLRGLSNRFDLFNKKTKLAHRVLLIGFNGPVL